MKAWDAIKSGAVTALRYWQVIAVLYLVNFLAALLLVALPALNLLGPAHRTAIRDAANGLDAWFLEEAVMGPITAQALSGADQPSLTPGLSATAVFSAVILGLLPFGAWLLGSALSGGTLLTFLEAPQPFSWRRFWQGCRRWFFPFLGFGIFQGFITLIFIVLAVFLIVPLWLSMRVLVAPVLVLVFLGVLTLLAVFEYTRIFAVLDEKRGVWKSFGEAIRFFKRNLPLVGLYYLLAVLALLAVHALFRLGLLPVLPLAFWPLVLIVQQAFLIARLWARLARLAGGMELAHSATM